MREGNEDNHNKKKPKQKRWKKDRKNNLLRSSGGAGSTGQDPRLLTTRERGGGGGGQVEVSRSEHVRSSKSIHPRTQAPLCQGTVHWNHLERDKSLILFSRLNFAALLNAVKLPWMIISNWIHIEDRRWLDTCTFSWNVIEELYVRGQSASVDVLLTITLVYTGSCSASFVLGRGSNVCLKDPEMFLLLWMCLTRTIFSLCERQKPEYVQIIGSRNLYYELWVRFFKWETTEQEKELTWLPLNTKENN